MKTMKPLLFLCLLLLTIVTGWGRINVTGLPGRDTVQLTIYNSADLTLVKETRVLTFKQGLNRLEFSWANTLIDPTSVEFRALTQGDKVEVLDVSFPPRVTNTLEWRIQSEVAGEVKVEIRYFTSGIMWSADYVAEADSGEKLMQLAGSVRINNQSGEDYENAQIRLVVGVIRLVESIVNLARTATELNLSLGDEKSQVFWARESGKGGGKARLDDMARKGEEADRKEIVKEALSEYFLYTVEGRDTVMHGWGKRLPSFVAKDVPVESYYKYERERYGDGVMRYYKFKNEEKSKLGKEPLPDGGVMAFRQATADKLYAFVGRTRVKYIPVGEAVEMELGNDAEVMVKPRLMAWEKEDIRFDQSGNVSGWTTKEQWQVELQNSKSIGVTVDVRRNFGGDWEVASADVYEKVDATKIKFVVPLKLAEKRTLNYTLTVRHGLNARK